MAIKEFKPAKSRFKVKYKKTYLCAFLLFIIVATICTGVKLVNTSAIAGYEKQIEEIQQKVDALNEENQEYAAVISSPDRSDYYEKIAREVYGYARPGEYVFYKTES